MKFNFQLQFVLQIGQGDLRGFSGRSHGAFRGCSPSGDYFQIF